MRKIAVLAIAGLMLALAAVAYAQGQENTYDVSGKVSPAKAGSTKKPVPVSIDFGYQVGEVSGKRPSPVKKYSIRFKGLRVNTDPFPKCSTATLENKGPSSCPKGSEVGQGFIENATGAKDNTSDRSIECNASVQVFNSGHNKGNLYIKGSPSSTNPKTKCAIELAAPIPTKYVKRGQFTALEFEVPASLLHPLPTLDNAVVSVTSKINKLVKKGKGYYEAIGGCKGGKREVQVVFTPETGAEKTAKAFASCSS